MTDYVPYRMQTLSFYKFLFYENIVIHFRPSPAARD